MGNEEFTQEFPKTRKDFGWWPLKANGLAQAALRVKRIGQFGASWGLLRAKIADIERSALPSSGQECVKTLRFPSSSA